MIINRQLQDLIEKHLFLGKAIMIIGARQVGKSTLFRQILQKRDEKILQLDCDEPDIVALLNNINGQELKRMLSNNKIVMIDEAQRVANIGLVMKRITDNYPDVQLLVTGSSSLDLRNKLNESLTGRKFEYYMYPLSINEIYHSLGMIKTKQMLNERLIYGSYPDVLNYETQANELIINLTNSYLYKDILALDSIRKPALLEKLVTALALQIGSEVSYNELSQLLGYDNKTIERYIDLLEKCYIIFELPALNRNLRNELKKSKKIYFYDNGIRNAIIKNFNPPDLRSDMGMLWENFVISERIKLNHYSLRFAKSYFWRTTAQQEIDYVEERNGKFTAFEMKWNPKKRDTPLPNTFLSAYDIDEYAVITPENYLDYLTNDEN